MSSLAKYWRRRLGDVRRMNDATEKATVTTPNDRGAFHTRADCDSAEPSVTEPDAFLTRVTMFARRALRKFGLASVTVALWLASGAPARADIIGVASVIDADTIEIHG